MNVVGNAVVTISVVRLCRVVLRKIMRSFQEYMEKNVFKRIRPRLILSTDQWSWGRHGYTMSEQK